MQYKHKLEESTKVQRGTLDLPIDPETPPTKTKPQGKGAKQ